MKQKMLYRCTLLSAIMLLFFLVGCSCSSHRTKTVETNPSTSTPTSTCEHDWKEATCTEAKTCSKCGETDGESLGHKMIDATCTEANKCSVCGYVQGVKKDHTITNYETILNPTCGKDGLKKGKCDVCGYESEVIIPATEEHDVKKWKTVKKATCSLLGRQEGTCKKCGLKVTNYTPKTKHVDDNHWVIRYGPGEISESSLGNKSTRCKNCKTLLRTEELDKEQVNCIYKAIDYLNYTSFSKKGLINQLKFEGFSKNQATLAVEFLNVNWYEQAVSKAESYLSYTSFSKKSLYRQLLFEGFTKKQANYAVYMVF